MIVGAYVGAPNNAEAERLAMTALERVGLADEQAHAIAGGLTTKQLRLMELARALAPRPAASAARRDARRPRRTTRSRTCSQIIRQVNRDGVTVVIIEHTMHAMVKLADHFSVLDHGKLIASGPPARSSRTRP